MPSITKEQFNHIISLQIARVQDIIIRTKDYRTIVQRKYPAEIGFDRNEYAKTLKAIYLDSKIPEIFFKGPDIRIRDVESKHALITYSRVVRYLSKSE